MVKILLRIHDPDPVRGDLVNLLTGQPSGGEFLLAGIAERIDGRVEGQQSLRVGNTMTNFLRNRGLLRNVVFVAPDAKSEFRESLEQWSCSFEVLPPITEEQIPGVRHRVNSASYPT